MYKKIDEECTNLTTADFGAIGGLVPERSNRKKNDHDHFYNYCWQTRFK
jgi:hypothetical protein